MDSIVHKEKRNVAATANEKDIQNIYVSFKW